MDTEYEIEYMNEIKELIAEGKKYRELCKMGYEKHRVKDCLEDMKKPKKCKNGVCPI